VFSISTNLFSGTIYCAIDGGVAANNPSTSGIAEALKLGYAIEDITYFHRHKRSHADYSILRGAKMA
jgi:patatin-like phospholipase/acyl hydrolase